MTSRCPTLIRPPVVNGKTSPDRGNGSHVRTALARIPRVQLTSFPGRHQTVVCTKHLLRLDLATARSSTVASAERVALRGLETHRFPPAGRLKTTGSDATSVPVRSQLGRGAAHSSWSRRDAAITVERARESNHHTELRDLRGPETTARSLPQRNAWPHVRAWSLEGSVRRRALPCSSSAFSRGSCLASPLPRPRQRERSPRSRGRFPGS